MGFFLGLLAAVACSSQSDDGVQAQAGSNGAGAGAAGTSAGGAAVGVAGTAGFNAAGTSSGGASSGGSGAALGGTTAAAGAAGAGIAPCSAAGLVLCDDFEQRTLGAEPVGTPWVASNCFDSAHVLKVDGSEAHSGTHSLVSQGIPYADCQLQRISTR
jgi:hypothetical protein